ncbi:hypothetical protein C10C_0493 [Chlamydia serpentis]|uniref:Uncharacterized protein n=1 Tax=Chlamydia serpentis TaxID=1967782 RepID=A0A2R8FBH7_9CHLA|nr:hypothetical protein [Chlamydia serpentis]SPN73656.1 hypothetical protein C10C_0493 [Chlamydia serpentis]
MDNYLLGILIFCCVLLSIGMCTIFVMTIFFLRHLNKILRNIHRITTILNFEAKILTPLILGKKLLCGWLKKRKNPSALSEDIKKFLDEKQQNSWKKNLCRGIKWCAALLLIWKVFRNKD